MVINLATIDLPGFSVNDFAHIIWEDTPNFPKPSQKKEIPSEIVGETWTRGIFRGAHVGEIFDSEKCGDDGETLGISWCFQPI